jgi:hypothetical protein
MAPAAIRGRVVDATAAMADRMGKYLNFCLQTSVCLQFLLKIKLLFTLSSQLG